jgi:ATPase family associated with various cellular activities (AAA)
MNSVITTDPIGPSATPGKFQALQTLILAYHPVIVMETGEEERVQSLVQGAIQEMGLSLLEWSATLGLTRSYAPGENRWTNECTPVGTQRPAAFEGTIEAEGLLRHMRESSTKAVYLLKDFTPHLEDATLVRQLREVVQLFSQTKSTIILVGDPIELPSTLKTDAVYYDLHLPGLDELHQVVVEVLKSVRIKHRIQVNAAEAEWRSIVQALSGMTLKQARQVMAQAMIEDGQLSIKDVDRILDRKAQIIRKEGILEFLPVDDGLRPTAGQRPLELGGFNRLKQWLAQASVGFTQRARDLALPAPKGILIVGIQGCGKSLAAKTIARAWQMPLLKLDAGRLYDKYVGESEKNFRRAIAMAESMAPAVLWIDEIEKSLGSQGSGDTDGGLSRRLFGSFLTWMQEKSESVFVIATANDIAQIPPELLRKGRFDEIFFVDLPNAQERAAIVHIHTQRHRQDINQFDLPAIIAATDGFSGAEIEQVVISGLYRSLYLNQPLSTEILVETARSTIPLSVSRREDIEALRAIAAERFVSVR